MEVETFVDSARERTLVTHVHLPATEAPAPLVVFAHGLSGHPKRFTRLLTAWAHAGYVAVAPVFPRTSDEAAGGVVFDDVVQQPADVSFVLDSLLRRTFAARIEAERVAVAGFSLGGMTVYGVGDARVRAAIAMSGRMHPLVAPGLRDRPLLVAHGEHDEVVPYADGLAAYRRAAPPKALVTLHVDGHHEPFEDYGTDAGPVIDAVTTAFLDFTLRDDRTGAARLRAAAVAPLASFEADGI